MNISKLSNALGALVKDDTKWLTISDSFKLCVGRLSVESQVYNSRMSDWISKNKQVDQEFFNNIYAYVINEDTVSFMSDVLIIDWDLTDDDGKKVKFTSKGIKEILEHPSLGVPICTRVLQFAMLGENFNAKWEDKIVKNS